VYDAYSRHSTRAPDPLLRERARLYAELEFAKWLVHGHELGREEIVDDAVALLTALADGVREDDLVTDAALGVDGAIALLDRVPDSPAAGDTSMQTDAYDPEELSLWVAEAEAESGAVDATDDAPPVTHFPQRSQVGMPAAERNPVLPSIIEWGDVPWRDSSAAAVTDAAPDAAPVAFDAADASTAPIDISAWSAVGSPARLPALDDDDDVQGDNDRSAESALRRWTAEQA